MKKIFILACSCLIMVACGNNPKSNQPTNADSTQVADMHTAENSLDIAGTYTGTFPAADCPGIKTTLTINNDKTFTLISDYIDRKDATFTETGTYTIEGNMLTLTTDGQPQYYKIGENTLTHLDGDKKEVTGELASWFVLKKQ